MYSQSLTSLVTVQNLELHRLAAYDPPNIVASMAPDGLTIDSQEQAPKFPTRKFSFQKHLPLLGFERERKKPTNFLVEVPFCGVSAAVFFYRVSSFRRKVF